jgi:predicted  nucleic acid-binding Zn-ribbon protein
MNATTANHGLVITAPNSLLQFCAHMDKLNAVIKTYADQLDRATQFIVSAYENSALAKQRAAKKNLTDACNAAQARVRKTLHQIAATFTDHNNAPTQNELRALVHDPHQANAPNIYGTKIICKPAPTITNNKGRQTTQD